jgi:uncharacterized protein YkwD
MNTYLKRYRPRALLAGSFLPLLLSVILRSSLAASEATATDEAQLIYLPLIAKEDTTPPPPIEPPTDDPFVYVNYFRHLAGVPTVTYDAILNDNCFQHARYMAENNHLTHDQDPSLPYASEAGQVCAEKGNAWLGGATASPLWQPRHSIEGWMLSVGHRLWLLYPTTPTFGYGFYTAANNRAGAALDALSAADFGADTAYPHWPVRYPAPEQQGVPAAIYPITLNWRYFGPAPVVTASQLTAAGSPIAHTVDTNLPVNHKGILVLPSAPLPANTTITVNVTGTYDGAPFTYNWSFHTAPTSSQHNLSQLLLPVPETHSPLANSPLANSPLANSPLANSPLANSPLANSPLANSPLANSQTRPLANSQTRP